MSGFDNLPKQLCIFLSTFLDIKEIGRMSRVNKYWNEALNRDQVKYYHTINKTKSINHKLKIKRIILSQKQNIHNIQTKLKI